MNCGCLRREIEENIGNEDENIQSKHTNLYCLLRGISLTKPRSNAEERQTRIEFCEKETEKNMIV